MLYKMCGAKLKCLVIQSNMYSIDYSSVYTLECNKGHVFSSGKRYRKCQVNEEITNEIL